MRILYLAAGIPVPGSLGGSTHAYEVARGLARLGHDVHLVAASREGWSGFTPFLHLTSTNLDGFQLYHQDLPKALTLLAAAPVLHLARSLQPDLIMERYYNFAGVGLIAARQLNRPALLEVNALIVDPPVVHKRRIDDMLGGPMRRWAEWQCRAAAAIITPLHTTVPPSISRAKIVELPWGADFDRFTAAATGRLHSERLASQRPRIVFIGSFRPWHGATDLVRAALLLIQQGHDLQVTLIGDGPERSATEALAAPFADHFTFTGAVPYDRVPDLLAEADIGVAPFVTAPHPALRAAGFFWSPLKIYEYMAAALPVVTAAIPPLTTIIRDGQEGLLYPEGDLPALAATLKRLIDAPSTARAMGLAARERLVEHYSWQRHCQELERIMIGLIER
jgi:glycosyltransferase involved in cell wall biosynthesis